MAKASVLFRIPVDADDVAEALHGNGAEGEAAFGHADCADVAEALSARAGEACGADFDADDPIDVIVEVADALERAGCPYCCVSDAFEERSRGVRALGRLMLNLTGEPGARIERTLPWEHGQPSVDRHALVAAGFTRSEAEAALDALLAPAAPPAPRAG